MSECVREWVSEWVSESVSEREFEKWSECVSQSPNQWLSLRSSQWVNEPVSDWVSEWVSQWVSEWASAYITAVPPVNYCYPQFSASPNHHVIRLLWSPWRISNQDRWGKSILHNAAVPEIAALPLTPYIPVLPPLQICMDTYSRSHQSSTKTASRATLTQMLSSICQRLQDSITRGEVRGISPALNHPHGNNIPAVGERLTVSLPSSKSKLSQTFWRKMYKWGIVRIGSIIIFRLSKLETVWCHILGEAAGEI